MKKLVLILFLFYSGISIEEADSLGFTDKKEAKNLMVNGKKEEH